MKYTCLLIGKIIKKNLVLLDGKTKKTISLNGKE
ncbi:hypothetical protein DESC_530007 [Desulfosarcina cetonica]|nr:hypothetical protein DESC_530007 [Desulfosarcina cetonica]